MVARPMASFAVSVVGRDRPGIVAALARVLLEHDVNVEDARMTILRGHLAMTLVIAAPEAMAPAALREGLDRVRAEVGLESVTLAEVAELDPGPSSQPTHLVSVYGADHPGIVHAVSAALAGRGWNITDLATRLVEGDAGAIYSMMLEVALPSTAATADLEAALAPVAEAEGVEVSSRELERDVL